MGYVGNLAFVAQVDGYTREDVSDIFVGMIADFGMATAPDRWIPADGRAVSRTLYPKLFARLGTTWGAGDGATTFNVPDLRETTTVGTGTRGSSVTSHDTYSVGEFKDDQMQQITGSLGTVQRANSLGTIVGAFSTTTYDSSTIQSTGTGTSHTVRFDSANSPGARTGTTTHGKQAGVLKCVFGGVA